MRMSLIMSTFVLAAAITTGLATPSMGQSLFGGFGSRLGSAKQPTSQPARRSGLFSFGKESSSAVPESGKSLNPFSKLFSKRSEPPVTETPDWSKLKMPGFNGQNSNSLGTDPSEAQRKGFPSWLPKRDPNKPSFFQKMNSQSKAMMKSASDWTQQATGLGQKPDTTWDEIREEMESIEKRNAQQDGPTLRPPVRSARTPTEPKFKF